MHGFDGEQYYAVESNPKTREMYSRYGIVANPYDLFKTDPEKGKSSTIIKPMREIKQNTGFDAPRQLSLFDFLS